VLGQQFIDSKEALAIRDGVGGVQEQSTESFRSINPLPLSSIPLLHISCPYVNMDSDNNINSMKALLNNGIVILTIDMLEYFVLN